MRLTVELSDEQLEAIAERAAQIVLDRQTDLSPWLNTQQAADYLACTTDRLYDLKQVGHIPYYKDGSRLLFRRDELDEWLRKGGGTRP